MSKQERDLLEDLRKLDVPEPDPALVRAHIAQAREEFERSARPKAEPGGRASFWRKVNIGLWWPVPAGAVALVALLALSMVLSQSDRPDPGQPHIAETESEGLISDQGPVRFGAQEEPPGEPIDPDLVIPVETQQPTLEITEDIRLSVVAVNGHSQLLLEHGVERHRLDMPWLAPGEPFELLDAFAPQSGQIAVLAENEAGRVWSLYADDGQAYRFDANASEMIAGAHDRADVKRQLPVR